MTDVRQEKLVGAIISLPTFKDENHNLLLDKQRKHIRWLLSQGVAEGNAVLLIAGGYGEGYFMEDDELYALMEVLVEETAGKVPTMAGIFDLSTRAVARRARRAADIGIDFLELGMPHYSSPSEDDIFMHHQYINDAADVGIMTYNNFWVMPNGFELTRSLFERFSELEHVVGFKWSSASVAHYTGILKLFADQYNFIDNGTNSMGARLGMKGFVDFHGNVAPRLTAHKWELFSEGRYDELDALLAKLHFDPDNELNTADAPTFSSVGDGVFGHVRWRLMGLEPGPNFPAQAQPSAAYVEHTRKSIDASGIREWIDFDQSIVE